MSIPKYNTKQILILSTICTLLYSVSFAQELVSTTTPTSTIQDLGNITTTSSSTYTNIETSTSTPILIPKKIIVGKAIWYGKAFQGRKMANGKKFDMNNPTIVAHRTLPFGTKIKVTNIKNNLSVDCIVSDRGPFSKKNVKLKSGKIEKQYTAEIDLSHAAAKILKIDKAGIGDVKIEVY